MALPTTYYEPTKMSDTVTVTRIVNGYLYQLQGKKPCLVGNDEISIVFEPISGATLYEPLKLSETVTATLIEGGYLYEVRFADPVYTIGGTSENATDHHSGFNVVAEGEEVTILDNKQMVNYNRLTIDGTLNIRGELILR